MIKEQPFAAVSVIIPCYRCSKTVSYAVASVYAQTKKPAEVLLVDDGSGDNTIQVLEKIQAEYGDEWVKVIRFRNNRGPSAARNAAWERATQPYVAFLDADDSWHPMKIELQLGALENHPDVALVSHPVKIKERREGFGEQACAVRMRFIPSWSLLVRNPFPTPTVLLRRDIPFRFDESMRRVEDYLLWVQIAYAGYRCAKLDVALAYCHKPAFGAGGLSGDIRAMGKARRDVYRKLGELGVVGKSQLMVARALSEVRVARLILIVWVRKVKRRVAVKGRGT